MRENSDNTDEYIREGDRLKEAGKFDEAIAIYQKVLTRQPHDAFASNKLADIYYTQGKLAEAIALCHQIVGNEPEFAPAYKTLGNALQAQNKIEAAARAYSLAIHIDPKFAEAQVNLGSMFYKQGLVDTAMILYQKAIAIAPDLAPAYWNLGKLLEQQGRLYEGFALQEKAIALQPNLRNLIHKSGEESPFEKWESDKFNSSSTAPGNYPQPAITKPLPPLELPEEHKYLAAGDRLLAESQFPEAIAKYQQAIEIKPDFAEAYSGIGMAILQDSKQQGRLFEESGDRALANFEKALEIQPQLSSAYRGWLELIEGWWSGNLVALKDARNKLTQDFAALRKSWRLSLQQVVYLCLATVGKLNRETISAQIKILKQVPDSILIYQFSASEDEADIGGIKLIYQRECQSSGVSFHRVKFVAKEEKSSLYLLADVILDVYPQNDVKHSLEALWFDLPLVSLTGENIVSKMGEIFLDDLGIKEGIARNWEEYAAWGIRLGKEEHLRKSIKQKLIDSKLSENSAALWQPEKFFAEIKPIFYRFLKEV